MVPYDRTSPPGSATATAIFSESISRPRYRLFFIGRLLSLVALRYGQPIASVIYGLAIGAGRPILTRILSVLRTLRDDGRTEPRVDAHHGKEATPERRSPSTPDPARSSRCFDSLYTLGGNRRVTALAAKAKRRATPAEPSAGASSVNGRNEGFGHLSSRVNCSPRTAFSQKRRVTLRPKGVEQQDAADEAGASHGASLLILVFCG